MDLATRHKKIIHAETVPVETDVSSGVLLVEKLIRLEIARLRQTGLPPPGDDYRGLYLSEEDVDRLLGSKDISADLNDVAFQEARRELEELAGHATGRLGRLIAMAGLNAFETACLLVSLASEIDLRFERLFAYIQDDVTRTRPSLEMVMRLLLPAGERLAARRAFSAGAPLNLFHLIELHGETGRPYTPLLAQSLAPDRRIVDYLLSDDTLDARLQPVAELFQGAEEILSPDLMDGASAQIEELIRSGVSSLADSFILLVGKDNLATASVASSLAKGAGLSLLKVNLSPLVETRGVEVALILAQREAVLQGAALLLSGLAALKAADIELIQALLHKYRICPLVVLSSEIALPWSGFKLELPNPEYMSRRKIWDAFLDGSAAAFDPAELDALAAKFRLNTEQIAAAVRSIRSASFNRDPHHPAPEIVDLYTVARQQSAPLMNNLARKITPRHAWEDIILPVDLLAQLRELCAQVDYRHIVYERWGFGKRVASGRGTMVLFSGPPGTGKTMAADIIAGTLRLDLYRIDLSGVVSKYIGETEKNLDRIFASAENSNAILFFDEADALFGKRSEIHDSHDRYANIEVAYLLQKMEEYEGVVILATNLRNNLDEAFVRRMHFVLDFPMPDENDRLRIWEATLPQDLPLSPEVDFEKLARRFKLSGGNIRNIILTAAFLAAADRQVVEMKHFNQAIRREFQKIGRLIPDDLKEKPLASSGQVTKNDV